MDLLFYCTDVVLSGTEIASSDEYVLENEYILIRNDIGVCSVPFRLNAIVFLFDDCVHHGENIFWRHFCHDCMDWRKHIAAPGA